MTAPPCFALEHEVDKRVLVLHSYHQGFPWTDSVQRGIESAFATADINVELSMEYMDTKRHPGQLYLATLEELYAAKYLRWVPDLVISCDDDALDFLFTYRDSLFPGVPVVFCGLNVDDYDPGLLKGRTGYTGVVERLDIASTLELIPRIQPDVERIAIVHDRTTTGLADRETIERLADGFTDRVEFVFPDPGPGKGHGLSVQELLQSLRSLPPRSSVYFLGFFRDRFDTPLAQETIIGQISAASPAPVYASAEAYLGYGILGGKLLSGQVHGHSTARKALRLLNGATVNEEPVSVESSNRYMFDYRQLKRFSIPTANLPEGSIVLFEPTSLMERHRTALIVGLAIVVGLVLFSAALLFNTVRRRRAERLLAAKEEQYRLLAHNATDMISKHDQASAFTYASPVSLTLTGYGPDELIGRSTYDFIHPKDIDLIRDKHEQILHGEGVVTADYRILHKQGHYVWIETKSQGLHPGPDGRMTESIAVSRDITIRKRAEEELKRSNELLLTAEGLAHVGSWEWNIQTGQLTLSDNWRSIHGFDDPEPDLDKVRTLAHPDDLPKIEQAMEDAMNGAPYKIEHRIITHNTRDVRHVQASGALVRDRYGAPSFIRGVSQDITEAKHAEAVLRQFERIVSRTSDLIALLDHDHRYVLVNAAYASYFGLSPDEMKAMHIADAVGSPNYEEFVKHHLRQCLAGEEVVHNRWQHYPRLGERYISVRLTPDRDEHGGITGVIDIIRDITELKKAEKMREDVERIMRHDLKSPLTGLMVLPDILQYEGPLNQSQMDVVQLIAQRTRDILRMIDLSLDIFRIEQGTYEFTPKPFTLVPVLERSFEDQNILISAKELQIQLKWTGTATPDLNLVGEELKAYSLFGNLVQNAVEAAPAASEVTITVHLDDDCTVTIANQGAVPESVRERFFEKYVTCGKDHGTGLGTYSAKLMADLHGWTIDMRTCDIEGTVLTVVIPGDSVVS